MKSLKIENGRKIHFLFLFLRCMFMSFAIRIIFFCTLILHDAKGELKIFSWTGRNFGASKNLSFFYKSSAPHWCPGSKELLTRSREASPQLPQMPLKVNAARLTSCCEPTRCSSKILVYFNTEITILNAINDDCLKMLIYFLAR